MALRGVREISRITGLSHVTVSRWVQSGTFPEMSTRPPKRGLLDPWKDWLEEQRESGNHNASQIWREMVAKGLIQQYIKHQPEEDKMGKQFPLPYRDSPFTDRKYKCQIVCACQGVAGKGALQAHLKNLRLCQRIFISVVKPGVLLTCDDFMPLQPDQLISCWYDEQGQ